MAAKLSPRVQQLVEEAADLLPSELAELLEAIQSLPTRADRASARHGEISARAARVHAGEVTTLSIDEVEKSIRSDLDF